MAQPDLEELYALVSVGDTVRLVGQRNDETARLFNPDRTTQNAIVAAMPSTPICPARLRRPGNAHVPWLRVNNRRNCFHYDMRPGTRLGRDAMTLP